MKKIIFTDLDGTLLNYDYSFDAAIPVLEVLKEKKIPIIFCTAKTFAENEYYQKKMKIKDPFIVENGGAIFIPKNYFSFSFECKKKNNYFIIELGETYEKLRNCLEKIRKQTGFKITGFGDMTIKEVAQDTHLSLYLANLAKKKHYNESFIFNEPKEKEQILSEKITDMGFALTHGGRYFNIHSKNSDKGKAVKILSGLFKKKYGKIKTIGIGDSANDVPMLNQVDFPAIVQNKKKQWIDTDIPNIYKEKTQATKAWGKIIKKLLNIA
ncbi:MAG: mannosyl-3-phosphoglycerate phosphatase [Candidatus Aenigmarchaeota archaeon ex4484_52]|nr:MAG: mannosyl-3-phosphoglycerate phosphatase [Candidatus Aenigmarchaeota archaeon ex4484_52]